MSKPVTTASVKSQSRKRKVIVCLALAAGLAALVLWFSGVSVGNNDGLFRGKPESEWVRDLKYNDDKQVREWRGYGEEGVQVLIRGLQRANHPGERAYRRLYRWSPSFLMRLLPAPKADSTRSKRMELVSLLSSLGNDAKSATPIMTYTLNKDEADSVRQIAINFFTRMEDGKCPINQMTAKEKKELLPAFIRSMQIGSLRNNAAIALRYYPEQREIVTPVLVAALQDIEPRVRLLAAEALICVSLICVDPVTAKKAGAALVVIAISKEPEDQVSSRAVAAMRFFKTEPELVVPALIESLESTNALVACEAVWALEWSPPEFKGYAGTVVPALTKAAQRRDNVGGYAKVALKRFQSEGNPTQVIK